MIISIIAQVSGKLRHLITLVGSSAGSRKDTPRIGPRFSEACGVRRKFLHRVGLTNPLCEAFDVHDLCLYIQFHPPPERGWRGAGLSPAPLQPPTQGAGRSAEAQLDGREPAGGRGCLKTCAPG